MTVVELDDGLASDLRSRWGTREDFRVAVADALEYTLVDGSPEDPWFVIGNLPYAITSPLLFHWLDQIERGSIAELVFMVQREVAERLAALPGSRAMGALTIGVRLHVDAELLFDVGPGSFHPPPKVRSSVVRLVPHDRWKIDDERRTRVRSIARELFGQRRKQLQKSLRSLPRWGLDRATIERIEDRTGLDLTRRPETLDMEEWLALEAALIGGLKVKGDLEMEP